MIRALWLWLVGFYSWRQVVTTWRALSLVLLMLLPACERTGPLRRAPGVVESVTYTPGYIVTGAGPAFGGRGGMAVVTTSIPESWIVLVRWKVGRLPVEDEALAQRVRLGDTVWVEYADRLRRDSTPTGELVVFGVVSR